MKGYMADTPKGTLDVCHRLKKEDVDLLVLKAQILAGGRGKGSFVKSKLEGGVQFDKDPKKIAAYSEKMFKDFLITKQTPPEGLRVDKIMVCEAADIKKELYFAILLDRDSGGAVMVVSTEGGVEIEDSAENTPEKIVKIPIDILKGLQEKQIMEAIKALELKGDFMVQFAKKEIRNLYTMFCDTDCLQLEVNPLAISNNPKKPLICIDAKLAFDDFAVFRQKELFAQEDPMTRDPKELVAEKFGLSYVGMDGSVGCMVNGAGLAMSTMDLIHFCGGTPANFLDVGGGADETQVTEAFKILQGDPNVKTIFVNIFGGIMRCDIIANGIINAAKKIGMKVPLVIRLEGTNSQLGQQLIRESGLKGVYAETDFQKSAELATKL